jgi:hypothetical protein
VKKILIRTVTMGMREKYPYLHRDSGNKREKIPYLHRHGANNRETNP